MRKKYKIHLLICILLAITFFNSIPLNAITVNNIPISDAEHKQIIQQFLREILLIQDQILSISRATLTAPPEE